MFGKLSLAQFFRDAATGYMGLELIEKRGVPCRSEIWPIIEVKSKSVVLQKEFGPSQLDLNYSSLVSYDGNFLFVYGLGLREMNRQERKVMEEWKKITSTQAYRVRLEMDAYSDKKYTLSQEKEFFKNSPCPYLFFDYPNIKLDRRTGKILDAKIRGPLILKYKVHKI